MKGFMLIDGNSLGHYYNNSKTLTIGSLQVQAVFGMLRGVRSLIATFPTLKPVVIWDGASWRKISFPTYKENRERSETENERKLLAARDEYKKQRPLIEGAFRLLGIPQVSAFNMEADDLGAIMTDRYVALGHSILLVTIDQDWLQLVGPKVSWKDVANKRLITASNFEEFTGVKDAKQFVELKAIVGDVGDNVPGSRARRTSSRNTARSRPSSTRRSSKSPSTSRSCRRSFARWSRTRRRRSTSAGT